METKVKIEGMVKKEPDECKDVEYEAVWNTNELKEDDGMLEAGVTLEEDNEVKEERNDVLIDFEGVWNYHKLKEEEMNLESAEEEKLGEDEEEEVKPPVLILVQPNSNDDYNVNCEERNIFDEDTAITREEVLSVEQKELCADEGVVRFRTGEDGSEPVQVSLQLMDILKDQMHSLANNKDSDTFYRETPVDVVSSEVSEGAVNEWASTTAVPLGRKREHHQGPVQTFSRCCQCSQILVLRHLYLNPG